MGKLNYSTFPKEDLKQEEENLIELTSSGRIPISANNIRVLPLDNDKKRIDLINEYSIDADLTLIGFHESMMKQDKGTEFFDAYNKIGNVLFVNTLTSKFIK